MHADTLAAILAVFDSGRIPVRDEFRAWGVTKLAELADEELEVAVRLVAEEARFAGDFRVTTVGWMLGSERGLSSIIGEARAALALAAAVVHAARDGRPLSLEERMTYGALTERHAEALLSAVREGVVGERDLAAMTRHGVETLNARVALPTATLPFESFDLAAVDRSHTAERVRVEAPVEIRHGATSFVVRVSGGLELWRAATFATKEPETVEWLETTLRDGDCLYDVGANIGLYTLFALALRPTVTAVSFEPDPVNHQRLCANLLANAFHERCLAFPIALSDRMGLGRFSSSRFAAGSSEHWVSPDMECDRRAEITTGCAVWDLDSFVAALGRPPTHLKVDVDGIESRVLAGASATLATLRHVLVEGRRASVEAARPLFESRGLHHVRSTRQAMDIGDHQLGRHLFSRS